MKARTLIAVAVALLLPLAVRANLLNTGDVLQVNSYTTDAQALGKVAADGAGNFVVSWVSDGEDGAGTAVARAGFTGAGATAFAPAVVNTTTAGSQGQSTNSTLDVDVGAAGSGAFLVVWSSPDGAGTGVFAQRYSSSGAAAGTEFRVNSTTSGDEENAAVAVDGAGNFIVAWQSYNDIFGQRYQSDGMPLGTEFVIDSDPALVELPDDTPDVAADAAGNFVVVWSNVFADAGYNGILARRYDSTGAPLGTEYLVNTYSTDIQSRARVAMKSTGEFVVVWQSYAQDASQEGVFGQRYDAAGVAQGTEFQVALATVNRQWRPDVAWDSSGGFVVVWDENFAPGRTGGVTARRFDASGAPMNAEAAVQRGDLGPPAVASLGGGELVVTWDNNPFGDLLPDTEVFAQRLRLIGAPCPATPAACSASDKGKLKINNLGDPKKRKFLWIWKGTAALADYDDPVNATDYALCIYDDSALVASYALAGGGMCDGKPCWGPAGTTGYKYKSKSTNAHGFFKVILKEGTGSAKILVKMRRGNLLLPVPASGTELFNQTTDLRLQLRKDPAGGPECWETVFGPGPTLNTPTAYQDSQP